MSDLITPPNPSMSDPSNPGDQGASKYIDHEQLSNFGPPGREKSAVLFNALLENIPEAILIANAPDFSFLVVSKYSADTLGIPRKELLLLTLPQLLERVRFYQSDGATPIPLEDHPLTRSIRDGDAYEDQEMVLGNTRGEMIPISSKGGPIRGKDGQVIGGILSWVDISERKRHQAELERYAREVQRSNRELEIFAYSASHDLQEPLRKIRGFSSLLVSRFGENLQGEARDMLKRVNNAAERMQRLIDDLLAYSRITTVQQPHKIIHLNRVIDSALYDLEGRIIESGAQVEVGPLPDVYANETQMHQLFINLIGNALKFSREGHAPHVWVYDAGEKDAGEEAALDDASVRNKGPGGWVRVAVRDNGIGFEMQYLEKMFIPFQRLHGQGVYDGSGIGLALCHKIVEQHGGKITASSRLGEGSTFWVTLPAPE